MLIRPTRNSLSACLFTVTVFGWMANAAIGADSEKSKVVWSILAAQNAYVSYLDAHPDLRFTYLLTHEKYGLDKDEGLLSSHRQSADAMKAGIGAASNEDVRNSYMALTKKYERMLEYNLRSYTKTKVIFYFLGSDGRRDSIDLLYRDYENITDLDPGNYTSEVWRQGTKQRELDRLQNRGYLSRPELAPRNRMERALSVGYESKPMTKLVISAAIRTEGMLAKVKSMTDSGKGKKSIGKDIFDLVLNEGPNALLSAVKNIKLSTKEDGGRSLLLLEFGASKSSGGFHEIVVDPNRGFIMLEKREYRGGALQNESVIGETFKDSDSGIYFPKKITATVYGPDGKKAEFSEYSDISISTIPKNADRDKLLTLSFPQNTLVFDNSVSPPLRYRLSEALAAVTMDATNTPGSKLSQPIVQAGSQNRSRKTSRTENDPQESSSRDASRDGGYGPFGKWGAIALVVFPIVLFTLALLVVISVYKRRKK